MLSTSSTSVSTGQGGVSATVGCIHAGGGGPGLLARARKAFDWRFQARSDFELRRCSLFSTRPCREASERVEAPYL
jgi:hypothetical protein